MSVPVIDIGALLHGSEAAMRSTAAEIGAAARDIGFFSVTNHGVDAALIDEMFAAAHEFFALPLAEKAALDIRNSPAYVGYAQMSLERLDPASAGDTKESFNMGRERAPDDAELLAGAPFVGRNQWPTLPGFRASMLRYYAACSAAAAAVHRGIALDLDLPHDYFSERYSRPLSALRLLHYPPHPGEFDGRRYGASPHTDYGGITLLAQDDNGGLEVRRRDGEWIAIDPLAGTFVCNIGDAMMRWTNDVYVSNAHRVINRSGRERYSAAFFCEPNSDAIIDCIPSCKAEGADAKYPPVRFSDYLRSRLERTYQPT
jgi:isopenicillin N synthase-like dioxygenase